MCKRPSTTVEADDRHGVGGMATGVFLGTLMWDAIFIALFWVGVLSADWAWVLTKTMFGLAAGWYALLFGAGARW